MSPKLVLWLRAGRGVLRLGFELRVLKPWPEAERIASALLERESERDCVSNGETAGLCGTRALGLVFGFALVGEVGEESSVSENSASSYLGTALRCVGRRWAPPDERFGSGEKGSFWLAPEGERETVVVPSSCASASARL